MNTEADCARQINDYTRRTESGCWEWQRARDRKGYGFLNLLGKTLRAHRVVYQIAFGAIPAGSHVLHRCDNACCVNPRHLFLGSNAENIKDKVAKDRASKSLTAEAAITIKGLAKMGELHTAIARRFGVHQSTVSRIVSGTRRPNLGGC